MLSEFIILLLSIIVTGLLTGIAAEKHYKNKIAELEAENFKYKNQAELSQNFINELKLEFSGIAKDAINTQQENLLLQHSADLKTKMELFKAEEITPLNRLLKDFKTSIDEYQKAHSSDTVEIKNAVATAERYAKALTSDQNTKGSLGEDLLEQVLNFANLQENIHYSKQVSTPNGKPDFIIHLDNDNHIIIDSKVILKKYLEYRESENDGAKQEFINDIILCINHRRIRKRVFSIFWTYKKLDTVHVFANRK